MTNLSNKNTAVLQKHKKYQLNEGQETSLCYNEISN